MLKLLDDSQQPDIFSPSFMHGNLGTESRKQQKVVGSLFHCFLQLQGHRERDSSKTVRRQQELWPPLQATWSNTPNTGLPTVINSDLLQH